MKKQFLLAVLLGLLISVTWATAQQRPRQFQLKADSPKFWELVPKDAKLELVSGGMGFTEGPVWDPSGFVYVSDEVLQQDISYLSGRAQGRTHFAGRSGWQHLRPAPPTHRLRKRAPRSDQHQA